MVAHRVTAQESKHVFVQQVRPTISDDEARSICKLYVNIYLTTIHDAQYQEDTMMNIIIEEVINKCAQDLGLTGRLEVDYNPDVIRLYTINFQVVRNALNIIMMKGLTRGAISVDSIQTAIETGAQEALSAYHEAIEHEDAEARRLFSQVDTRVKHRGDSHAEKDHLRVSGIMQHNFDIDSNYHCQDYNNNRNHDHFNIDVRYIRAKSHYQYCFSYY